MGLGRAALDRAGADDGTRDVAELTGTEHLTDLGRTDDFLALLGCEHAAHG